MDTTLTASKPIETGEVPKVTLELITGSQEKKGGRSAGIFTADDLISILLYVRKSRQLPSDLPTFIKELGTDSTGIAGLEPINIIELYRMVTDHANRWTPVETQVKKQASDLTEASKKIVIAGKSILKWIDKMDISEQQTEIGNTDVNVPLTSDNDKMIQEKLPKVIEILRLICVQQQKETREVRALVSDYRIEISGGSLTNGKKVNGLGINPQNFLILKNVKKGKIE